MTKKSKDLNLQKINSILGPGTVLDGNFTTKDTTRVEGTINGNFHSEGTVIVGSEGIINGNVTSANLILGGTILGDVTAKGKVEVTSTGVLKGNIITKSLVIDENAVFQGNCAMINEIENQGKYKGKTEVKAETKAEVKTDVKAEEKNVHTQEVE